MTARLIALAAILAALIGAAWYIDTAAYERGVRDVREEVQKVATQAEEQNAAVHRKQIETLVEATHAKEKRLQTISDDRDRALFELSGLRSAASAGRGSGVPTTGSSAGDEYATAVADVLGQCGEELVKVARAADGHAADALMCTQAWPK